MKYLKKFGEQIKISVLDQNVKKLFPKKLKIETSNGTFELTLSDYIINPPKIYSSYYHFTPDKTGNVLSDGEPDYLCMDFNFMKVNDQFEINVEITYGDAMMFEFKLKKPNSVEVFVYNGYGSKFDPEYQFAFTESSISDIIELFNRFGYNFKRDDFNFLDTDKNSYHPK